MKQILSIILLCFVFGACKEDVALTPATDNADAKTQIENAMKSGQEFVALPGYKGVHQPATTPFLAMPDVNDMLRRAKPLMEGVQIRGQYGCGGLDTSKLLQRGVYTPTATRYQPYLVVTNNSFRLDTLSVWTDLNENFSVYKRFISRYKKGEEPLTVEAKCETSEAGWQALQVIELRSNGSYYIGAYWIKGSFAQLGLPADTRYLVTSDQVPQFHTWQVGNNLPQTLAFDMGWGNGIRTGLVYGQTYTTRIKKPCESLIWAEMDSFKLVNKDHLIVWTKSRWTGEGEAHIYSEAAGSQPNATHNWEGVLNHSGGLYLSLPKGWLSYNWYGLHSLYWDGSTNTGPYNVEDQCRL